MSWYDVVGLLALPAQILLFAFIWREHNRHYREYMWIIINSNQQVSIYVAYGSLLTTFQRGLVTPMKQSAKKERL